MESLVPFWFLRSGACAEAGGVGCREQEHCYGGADEKESVETWAITIVRHTINIKILKTTYHKSLFYKDPPPFFVYPP